MNRSLYLFLFLFLTTILFSQNEYRFRNITTANGLSQSSVIEIHQDKLGQMWFGTRDGLNKYNGTDFKIYRNQTKDSLSISNNDILSIEEDTDGNMWIGTYNGLNKYNPITDAFTRFFHTNNKNSLADNTIWDIVAIDDEIWMGTSKGLSIYHKKTKTFTSLFHNTHNDTTINSNFVIKIYKTNTGEIWIGTSKGLCKLISRNASNFVFKRYKTNLSLNNNSPIFIQDIIEDTTQNIWIATKTKGLFKLSKDTEKLVTQNGISQGLDLDIRAMNFDKHRNLWLGSSKGISIAKKTTNKLAITSLFDEFRHLNKIKSIFTDQKGSVWIGTYYGGVYNWDISNVNFLTIDQNTANNPLSYNVVSAIQTDTAKNIYFGTEGGGITILNTLTKKIHYINSKNTHKLASNNIKALAIIKDELWIGTFAAGLSIYHLKTKKISTQKLPKSLQKILKQTGVYSIKKEDENNIWIGTFGKGIIRYNRVTKDYYTFQNEPNTLNSLSNNRVRSILIDTKNRIWIGTQSGLNLLTINQDNTSHFKHFFFDKKSISGVDILTLFEDSHHNIWVGTKAKGFYLFNGNSFKAIEINSKNLQITTIHAILEDSQHNLWLSSNHGIVKYNPSKKEAHLYNQTDGLTSNEFTNNSCLATNSQFYFGGSTGVSYFNPNNIYINTYTPQVILTDFKVNNKTIKAHKNSTILKKSITYTKEITLSYDKANFSINFAIPNFINSTNNQYSYRMVGLEDNWITTSKNEATYTIQNQGTYTFEVKGANNDGRWNKKPTTLTVIVKPAPWKSWWAYTLYTLFIVLALVGLIRFIKSKTKLKHELELEHLENERNEEINKAKLTFFTNISHEFRTPLSLILGPLQQLLIDYKGSNKIYKKLLVIENNANHLVQLINRLMDFRKLENKQFNLQAAEGNIVKFLQEIYLSFCEYAKDGNYNYTFTPSNDSILVYFDRDKLERVFYNLISNAFRYTPKGGSIEITIANKGKNLIITVEDSGVGVAEQYLTKIFDRFFEVPIHNKPQENYNKGTGIGLSIAKNIVELHKGTITAKNKSTKGTIFTVILPLGSAHLSDTEILKDFIISDEISQYKAQLEEENFHLNEEVASLITKENAPTILLVEDNKPLRTFIKNLLAKDYVIIEAENGKIALKKALKHIPDLIISDVIMPEMVGTEFCSKIKNNLITSHIPVILLTARTSLIYKLEGLESGADEYISKPFNIKEFQLRVKNMIESTQRLKNKFSKEDNLNPSEITVSSLDEQLLKKAFKIVEDHIEDEHFDIPFFCSELGVSRTMLFTKIKAWTNFTPNQFIHEIRMKRAVQLLEQQKINIAQISYKVGFKNPKYFSKCFQKRHGVTPSEFQQKFSSSFDE